MTDLSKVVVSSSPHIKTSEGTTSIMGDVIIALIPALVLAITNFGWRALVLTCVSVITCVVSEAIFNKINKQDLSITDLSAVVTGIILAFNVPVSLPIWTMVIGAAFSIIVVKMIFGGLGQNFINPALGGRMFLLSWTGLMTTWTLPKISLPLFGNVVDVVTTATPLATLKTGALPDVAMQDMLLGSIGGCLGETSAIALLAGGLYLLFQKVITPIIPVSYIGTVFLIAFLFPQGNDPLTFATAHILTGGLMLGAIFMATDYVTSPVSAKGQLIFGIGCGLITIFIRFFGGLAEGVSFSIVIMNACVFLIDKYTMPKRFGMLPKPKKVKTAKEAE
ncbi:MAG: RnfABCDGE type electron transport complex subunit D [Clostridia bacterium]